MSTCPRGTTRVPWWGVQFEVGGIPEGDAQGRLMSKSSVGEDRQATRHRHDDHALRYRCPRAAARRRASCVVRARLCIGCRGRPGRQHRLCMAWHEGERGPAARQQGSRMLCRLAWAHPCSRPRPRIAGPLPRRGRQPRGRGRGRGREGHGRRPAGTSCRERLAMRCR